jgi:hypothetical protein
LRKQMRHSIEATRSEERSEEMVQGTVERMVMGRTFRKVGESKEMCRV